MSDLHPESDERTQALEARARDSLVVVEPLRRWIPLELRELWAYRELLYFLVWRDVKVRYKQTVLGVGWAVLQPLLVMVVFTAVFGEFAKIPSDGIPYPVFAYAALLPWNYFAGAFGRAGNSLVGNSSLITKVYFPRVIIPVSAVLAGLVDFAVAFVVLVGLLLYYDIRPTTMIWTLPFFLLLALVAALAAGIWLSALNVKYRDVSHLIPFLAQVWMYASPVAYSSNLVPERWRGWFNLNPLSGVIGGFRAALLGTAPPDWRWVAASATLVLAALVLGLVYFQRMEASFADTV